LKKAFSLIEVVFAIIIVAISLMSVPMLLKQSSKSDEASIIQESVLASSTKMGNILSFPWDSASYDTTNKVLRVLDVSNSGDSELARDTTSLNSNYRKGHIVADKRRRFFDSVTNPTASTTTMDNISYFHNKTATIGGSGAYDYKDSGITMASKVFYINDNTNYSNKNINFTVRTTPIVNSTNIKMIELTTTSPLLGRSFVLRTFSCNIGQSGLLERTY
jgi:prepilin-type N-terminal cleavage/methylation domain-containing protein